MRIPVDRSSVHAGDDTEPHADEIEVPDATPLRETLARLRAESFLPSISGGRASWVLWSGGPAGTALAVVTQQWHEPRFLVDPDLPAGTDGGLFFEYRTQQDPDEVYAELGGPPGA